MQGFQSERGNPSAKMSRGSLTVYPSLPRRVLPRPPLGFRPPIGRPLIDRVERCSADKLLSAPLQVAIQTGAAPLAAPLPLFPAFSLIRTSYALISAAPPPPCTCCSGVSCVSTTWSVPFFPLFFFFFYAFVFLYPIIPMSLICLPCVPPT